MTADSKQSLNASMELARQKTATQDSKMVFKLNKMLGDETETFVPFTERRLMIFSMGLAHAVKLEGLTSAILQLDLKDTFEGYHKAEPDCALEEL
ncbi:hypothetical protein F2Q69_00045347 [Brassica cretica]|uniref:Uncharacterized protein n=1 Tax=Brassica cretica TaxID=69181 RepID=A0A8S9N649_BRACR|nr:hypothetical protein F2Q69_00045347 [Brassica cretica]